MCLYKFIVVVIVAYAILIKQLCVCVYTVCQSYIEFTQVQCNFNGRNDKSDALQMLIAFVSKVSPVLTCHKMPHVIFRLFQFILFYIIFSFRLFSILCQLI